MKPIRCAARKSPLSLVQVQEILSHFRQYYPQAAFEIESQMTQGDHDLKSSLKLMEKTNFFTDVLDELVLSRQCDIAIHSAKDLPEPLPEGLQIIALTKSISSKDVLVLPEGKTLSDLHPFSKIGTSTIRREELVKKILPKFVSTELRGPVDKRVEMLYGGKYDAIVVAEAALLRLGLKLNQIELGEGPPLQGQLAVVARKDHALMAHLFHVIDSRNCALSLYTGLDPMHYESEEVLYHEPLIEIQERELSEIDKERLFDRTITHYIFTSKTSVHLFMNLLQAHCGSVKGIQEKTFFCVGAQTAAALSSYGKFAIEVAKEETQEGLIELLDKHAFSEQTHVAYPKSAIARKKLVNFLSSQRYKTTVIDTYQAVPRSIKPKIPWKIINKIIFTSSSTVDACRYLYPEEFETRELVCYGPITQKYLSNKLSSTTI